MNPPLIASEAEAREYARECVRTASERVKNRSTKSWLFCDERGTWERLAIGFLTDQGANLRAAEQNLSIKQFVSAVADMIAFQALNASLQFSHRSRHKE